MSMKVIASLCLLTVVAIVAIPQSAHAKLPGVASSAEATNPLKAGQKLPDVSVKNEDGKSVPLSTYHQDSPLVIVFYRGSWCPICTRHFQELLQSYPEIKKLGASVIAISPDTVENSAANAKQLDLPFPLLSDSDLTAARKFGIAFKVDDATLTKYQGYGINLKKASGQDHESLPVPAVYIVDQSGKVVFAHSNPNYRERLESNRIVEELKQQN